MFESKITIKLEEILVLIGTWYWNQNLVDVYLCRKSIGFFTHPLAIAAKCMIISKQGCGSGSKCFG